METEAEETKHKGPGRRSVATKLWVYYAAPEAQECGLISFDFKTDLDEWLKKTNARPISIIRGVEKKFTTVSRIHLS